VFREPRSLPEQRRTTKCGEELKARNVSSPFGAEVYPAKERRKMVKLTEEQYKGMFLKADDLGEESLLVKIIRFAMVEIEGQKDPQESLYVDAFKRPLSLNKTNMQVLVKEFGDETDAWAGQHIRFIKGLANNPKTGAQVDSIKIKPYVKQAPKAK
jgi:hypothetical protein